MEIVEVQFISRLYRKLGIKVAEKLVFTRVKPHYIIYFYIALGFIAAGLLLTGKYFWIVIAGIFYQIALFLDYVDGSLARARGIEGEYGVSELGGWLDSNGGLMVDFIVLVAAIFGEYIRYNDPMILQLGILAVGTKFLIRTLYLQSSDIQKIENIDPHAKINRLKSLAQHPILAEFAYTRFSPAGTLFTLFALVDALWLYIVIMGIYGTLYYFAAFALIYYKQL